MHLEAVRARPMCRSSSSGPLRCSHSRQSFSSSLAPSTSLTVEPFKGMPLSQSRLALRPGSKRVTTDEIVISTVILPADSGNMSVDTKRLSPDLG
jgi:hypothetical protein